MFGHDCLMLKHQPITTKLSAKKIVKNPSILVTPAPDLFMLIDTVFAIPCCIGSRYNVRFQLAVISSAIILFQVR